MHQAQTNNPCICPPLLLSSHPRQQKCFLRTLFALHTIHLHRSHAPDEILLRLTSRTHSHTYILSPRKPIRQKCTPSLVYSNYTGEEKERDSRATVEANEFVSLFARKIPAVRAWKNDIPVNVAVFHASERQRSVAGCCCNGDFCDWWSEVDIGVACI